MMFNVKENIRPVSYFRTNASDMMNFVTEKKEPVIITQNDEFQAVLIDIESYQNMIDAFNMLKLLRFSENDIKNGRFSEASEVFARVKQKYGVNG